MSTIIKMKITEKQLRKLIRESFIDARERFKQAGQKNRGILQKVGGGEVVSHPGADFSFPDAINIFDLALTQARALTGPGEGVALFKNLDPDNHGEQDRLVRLFSSSLSRVLKNQGLSFSRDRKINYVHAADSFAEMVDNLAAGGYGVDLAQDAAHELLHSLRELQVV